MIREPQVPMFDLIMCLSSAMDLVDPAVVNHHKRVAYIAQAIGAAIGLTMEQQRELALAAAVHDIGALSLREKMNALEFESHFDAMKPVEHAETGYWLLRDFKPLASAAALVRYHHLPWRYGAGRMFGGEPVPVGGSVLFLADRVAVLIGEQMEILGQAKGIVNRVEGQAGRMFAPDLVEAFLALATKEYFWLDVVSSSVSATLRNRVNLETVELSLDDLLSLAELFSKVIDFRSPFTATHSGGVAAVAEALSGFLGFSGRERRMIRIAGYLHDLGKLMVPTEVLDKPGRLSDSEFNIVRGHTYHSYRILEHIKDLDLINSWGSLHHERMDGNGYPFHLGSTDLPVGSRIMAVADVFAALKENRPYREGMTNEVALRIIEKMVDDSALDADIVALLTLHLDEIDAVHKAGQALQFMRYQELVHSKAIG